MKHVTISIESEAEGVDEALIQKLIQEHMLKTKGSIKKAAEPKKATHRKKKPAVAVVLTPTQKIESLFAKGDVVTNEEVYAAVPEMRKKDAFRIVFNMLTKKQIKKISQGHYVAYGVEIAPVVEEPIAAEVAVEQIQEEVTPVRDTGFDTAAFLEAVSEPIDGLTLRKTFGFFDRKIRNLVMEGKVFRQPIPKNAIYCSDWAKLQEAVNDIRALKTPVGSGKIMNVLPTQGYVFVKDIAEHLKMPLNSVELALKQTCEAGWTKAAKISFEKAVMMTDDGRSTSYAKSNEAKVSQERIVEALGDRRASIVEVIGIFGSLESYRITMALRGMGVLAASEGVGMAIPVLEDKGIIVSKRVRNSRRCAYSLTELGQGIWAAIKNSCEVHTREELNSFINERVEAASKKRSARLLKTDIDENLVIKTLKKIGRSETEDILLDMTGKKSGMKSLELVLEGLAERKLVIRKKMMNEPGHPVYWTASKRAK